MMAYIIETLIGITIAVILWAAVLWVAYWFSDTSESYWHYWFKG